MDFAVITADEMEAFFRDRLQALGLEQAISVRDAGTLIGKGMFAEKMFEDCEIIYNEMHVFGRKLYDQVLLSCDCCLKVIGTPSELWDRCEARKMTNCCSDNLDCVCDKDYSQGDDDDDDHHCGHGLNGVAQEKEHGEDGDESQRKQHPVSVDCPDFERIARAIDLPLEQIVVAESIPCRQGCGAVYCSEACANKMWISSHQLMCPVTSPAMREFIDFTNQTNEVLHMVGEVIAALIIYVERAGSSPDALARALVPIRMFIAKPWTDVASVPADIEGPEAVEFKRVLEFLIDECQEFLSAALSEYSSLDLFAPLFSTEFISRMMGLFESNNIRMSSRSALALVVDKLEDLNEVPEELLSPEQIIRLGRHRETTTEGVGLYSLHSSINHSCDPNCALLKLQGGSDAKVALIALRQIAKGEEITISYIDETVSLEERRLLLVDYGFKCACLKCLFEDTSISEDAA